MIYQIFHSKLSWENVLKYVINIALDHANNCHQYQHPINNQTVEYTQYSYYVLYDDPPVHAILQFVCASNQNFTRAEESPCLLVIS